MRSYWQSPGFCSEVHVLNPLRWSWYNLFFLRFVVSIRSRLGMLSSRHRGYFANRDITPDGAGIVEISRRKNPV